MNDTQFDSLLEDWASQEMEAAPELRPTQEMYRLLNTKRGTFVFPVFARWATVGAALAFAILVALFYYPGMILQPPSQKMDRGEETRSVGQAQDAPDVTDDEKTGKAAGDPVSSEAVSETPAGKDAGDPPGMGVLHEGSRKRGVDTDRQELFFQKSRTTSAKKEASGGPAPEAVRSSPARSARPPAGAEQEMVADDELTGREESLSSNVLQHRKGAAKPYELRREDAEKTQIGAKTFHQQSGVWIDADHSPDKTILTIQRESQAYYDLLEAMPELEPYFELGQHVIVNRGDYSIAIADEGKTDITADELHELWGLE